MAGVDLYTVQRAGGWKTAIMVQRYAHLSPDDLRAAVERMVMVGGETESRRLTPEREIAFRDGGKTGRE
jgi:hypothetical protein